MTSPLVHVLVINWNGLSHLEDCFQSLLSSTYDNARFVLLDNASTDDSIAYVREHFGHDDRVEIVECGGNLGWSRGNNVGIERALAADAKYVLLLNNDTWTDPAAIERLVAAAEANAQIGALAPRMQLFDTPDVLNSLGLECSIVGCGWDIGLGRIFQKRMAVPRKVIGVCGGACLIRSSAIRKAGLLPTDFDIYLDDLDLSLRIWNAGFEIWNCPDAIFRHKFSATMGTGKQFERKYFLNTRNRFRLMQRCFPQAHFARIARSVIWGEIRAVGRAILNREWWKVGIHVRSWRECWAYRSTAASARAEMRSLGLVDGAFWPLVEKRQLFFPGILLPFEGWYPAISHAGRLFSPISSRAVYEGSAVGLRVFCTNCYPAIQEVKIEVRIAEKTVSTMRVRDGVREFLIETHGRPVEFLSRAIFWGEQTGERMDIGGWLHIQPLS